MSTRHPTCAQCHHSEFTAVSRIASPNSRIVGLTNCIYCHLAHSFNNPNQQACDNFLPENKQHFLQENGLYEFQGWLIPDNVSRAKAPQYIQKAKRKERELTKWLKQQHKNNKKKKAKKKNQKESKQRKSVVPSSNIYK